MGSREFHKALERHGLKKVKMNILEKFIDLVRNE